MKSRQLQFGILRIIAGVIVIVSATFMLVRMIGFAYVDWQFRTLPADLEPVEYMSRLQNLLELDPHNGRIRNYYASILARTGDYTRALREHEQASLTQNVHNNLFFRADLLEKMLRESEAEKVMAQCLVINPTDREFNPRRLRLLNRKLDWYKAERKANPAIDQAAVEQAHHEFAHAARNWYIRAYNDINAYLFMGQYYLDPLEPYQAYRNYLMGLSGAPWMGLTKDLMFAPADIYATVQQLLEYRFVKPYRDLP